MRNEIRNWCGIKDKVSVLAGRHYPQIRRFLSPVTPRDRQLLRTRKKISKRFIAGNGIEIGALHEPLFVSRRALVTYVDRLGEEGLRKHYPELKYHSLAHTSVVDDGESLKTFPDGSLDFVISNHVLEHCENPLRSLDNWLRVLKPSGVIYLAVPDKRFTFDCDRPVTPLSHVIRDYGEGPSWSRKDHYQEWTNLVDKKVGVEGEKRAADLDRDNYSIHFHVWDPATFLELVSCYQKRARDAFEMELFERNQDEVICILRKANDNS